MNWIILVNTWNWHNMIHNTHTCIYITYLKLYLYMYISYKIIFHFKLLQDSEYNSLCYIVDPCFLSIWCIRSVVQSCPTLCDPMNHSTPGLPVHHQLPEVTQTHVHRVSDAIQPSHPLSSPSPLAPNPSRHE